MAYFITPGTHSDQFWWCLRINTKIHMWISFLVKPLYDCRMHRILVALALSSIGPNSLWSVYCDEVPTTPAGNSSALPDSVDHSEHSEHSEHDCTVCEDSYTEMYHHHSPLQHYVSLLEARRSQHDLGLIPMYNACKYPFIMRVSTHV